MRGDIEERTHVAWDPGGGRPRTFSGHESFAIRYGWLPKLHEAVASDPELFSSDERAILKLGLGRNMVKSLRFWGEALGLIQQAGKTVAPSRFAQKLLDPERGLDPYLEDPGSLWRLHWHMTAHAGMGAWVVVFQETPDPEITRERLVERVRARALTVRGPITPGTATAHVDIFLKTYATGVPMLAEESLGCPFQELGLLTVANSSGKLVVRLTRGSRPELDDGALAFAIRDFWTGASPRSSRLSLRSLLLDRRGPGSVFRLDEGSLHQMLEVLCSKVTGLELREDGAGGVDVVATGGALENMEDVAWPAL